MTNDALLAWAGALYLTYRTTDPDKAAPFALIVAVCLQTKAMEQK